METTYELWVEDPCPAPMECIRAVQLIAGNIRATDPGESVSVDLAHTSHDLNIEPDTLYTYWVIATNADGTVESRRNFKTLSGAEAPSIGSVSISHLTLTDATLEAQIDTEGLPSTYQFDLWSSPCSSHGAGCEVLRTISLPSGLLLGSFAEQTVSLDLNSAGVTLGGGEYGYSVTATSAAGSTQSSWQIFEVPASVVDPPSLVVLPQSGGEQATTAGGGNQAAESATAPMSGTVHSQVLATSPLGAPAKTDAPKGRVKHKHKVRHKYRRSKIARRLAKTEPHKR
jgi:hypothetical protein